jgi:hypothetical protein
MAAGFVLDHPRGYVMRVRSFDILVFAGVSNSLLAGTPKSVSPDSSHVIYAVGLPLALISLSLIFVADVLREQ